MKDNSIVSSDKIRGVVLAVGRTSIIVVKQTLSSPDPTNAVQHHSRHPSSQFTHSRHVRLAPWSAVVYPVYETSHVRHLFRPNYQSFL